MFQKFSKLYFHFFLMFVLVVGSVACNSQKKIAEQQRQEKIAKAKTDLQAALDNSTISADELEKKINQIKAMNLGDEQVNVLIKQAEEKLAKLRAEEKRKADEEAKRKAEEEAKRKAEEEVKQKEEERRRTIYDYFNDIQTASSADEANRLIKEALALFEKPDAAVLIIIAIEGNEKDYDKPTTAEKYFNLIKDQKRSDKKIHDVIYGDGGKIKRLELIKK